MLTLAAALKAAFGLDVLTLATCIEVTLKDATVLRYTDHDEDLTVGGNAYLSSGAYTASNIEDQNDLTVANMQLAAILASATQDDIEAGLYDGATFKMFVVNWQSPDDGQWRVLTGRLGNIRIEQGQYVATPQGISRALHQTVGEVTSDVCRADLGDARCKVDLTPLTMTGTVTGITDEATFTDSSRTEADTYFALGLLVFTSGAANKYAIEVKLFAGGVFTLSIPPSKAFAVGDSYSVYPGCDKSLDMCINKFANVANRRAEDYVPGFTALIYGGQ